MEPVHQHGRTKLFLLAKLLTEPAEIAQARLHPTT
jgi:hypothetical protein